MGIFEWFVVSVFWLRVFFCVILEFFVYVICKRLIMLWERYFYIWKRLISVLKYIFGELGLIFILDICFLRLFLGIIVLLSKISYEYVLIY